MKISLKYLLRGKVMALLLNRKYGSRLECLYYILQSLYAKYSTKQEFGLKEIKYDANDNNNVHKFCKRLKNCAGIYCCPYLINPLNASKCYATQSLESDSTKSKAVSDIGGSLEALGFIEKVSPKSYKISDSGKKWVNEKFGSKAWNDIALAGVLTYGPMIGFLSKLRDKPDKFSYSGIYLGYPHTDERVIFRKAGRKEIIQISTDSQKDSNTRTTSRLIAWAVATGLLEPCDVKYDTAASTPYKKYRDFLNADELTVRCFKKTPELKSLFSKKLYVENPLAFSRLHKNVASLRENGGETLREATLQYNNKILNRRYAFVYLLNDASKKNKELLFDDAVKTMSKHKDYFFSDGNDPFEIMGTECEVADITGIPFELNDNNELKPLTMINLNVLESDAPNEIMKIVHKLTQEMENK